MPEIQVAPEVVPRLPVLGWDALTWRDRSPPSMLLDAPHIRYTTSGRAAIALGLRVLGIGHGDRVLVPTYHCPTMIAPATHAGAKPVFYPILESGAPSCEFLDRVDLSGVKGLLVAHYFGIPQPLARLRAFCDQHRIALIEDCAHVLFGDSDGKPVGSWGDVAVASLTKFFPVPEGGSLSSMTRALENIPLPERGFGDEVRAAVDVLELSARYRRMAGLNGLLAASFRLKRRLRGGGEESARTVSLDDDSVIDTAEAESSFDAAVASQGATRTSRWLVRHADRTRLIARRRRNYAALAERLAGIDGTRIPWPELPPSAAPYVFPLSVEDPDRRYYALKAAGLPVFRWDQLWPGTPANPLDHGRRWSREIFQLPCHQDLAEADLDWMARTLRSVFDSTPARRNSAPRVEPVAARAP